MSLTDNRFFRSVRAHADSMLEVGRDPWPDDPSPLFAGVVDAGRRQASVTMTIPPPGIRTGDFNWCGNNLMHDIPFLETLDALGHLSGDARYAEATDAVFSFYGANCPHPKTGLFPWGEHAQWSFPDKQPLACGFGPGMVYSRTDEYIIHDHLRFAPLWFWDRMWAKHPQAVVRFAHGLDYHLMNPDTFEHNRHAPLAGVHWNEIPYEGMGKDFARHSGHYIFECCFAYRKSGDTSLLDWARRKLAWHMDRRLADGLIRGCARTSTEDGEGQHDALALALWDAAQALGPGTPEGCEFAGYTDELFEARRSALKTQPMPMPEGEGGGWLWMSGYFRKAKGFASGGNILMHQRAGIQAYADAVVAGARWAIDQLPPPTEGVPVLARSFAGKLGLYLTAFELTGERAFLDKAAEVADWAHAALFRNDLFMGVSNQRIFGAKASWEHHTDPWAAPPTPGFYYSVTGTPQLVRDLLRLALLMEDEPDTLGPDIHSR